MQYDPRPMFLKQQEKQQQAVVHLVYQVQWVPERKQSTSEKISLTVVIDQSKDIAYSIKMVGS